MEHFREKQKRHDHWLHRARMLAATSDKQTCLDHNLSTSNIQALFPDAEPLCHCTDDSDRCLGIVPNRCKNGQYQLRTICYLCLREGKKNLRWDTLGEKTVILIFANHFRRHGENYV